jgi:hypothetical protein
MGVCPPNGLRLSGRVFSGPLQPLDTHKGPPVPANMVGWVNQFTFPIRRTFEMRFYTEQHQYYCGIDLHARTMFLCVLDQSGKICFEKNLKSHPDEFLTAIQPFRSDIVVCVECLFTWY